MENRDSKYYRALPNIVAPYSNLPSPTYIFRLVNYYTYLNLILDRDASQELFGS
jgi:hypothetical protein